MKFIIFICNRLRQGQFPRLSDFPYNEQIGKYIYGGKYLTAEEFNAACEKVFDPNYRTNGFSFRPEVVIEVPASTGPSSEDLPTTSEDPAPSSEDSTPTEPAYDVTDDPFHGFFMDGTDIYFEGVIVGRVFEGGSLKMVKGHGNLREKAALFLASQIPAPVTEEQPLV